MDLQHLISNIETIASNFVAGAVFLFVYNFVSWQPYQNDKKYFIFKSLVASFIINQPLSLIGLADFYIVAIAIGAALGLGLGLFVKCPVFQKLTDFLGINRTVNKDFYANTFLEKGMLTTIKMRNDTRLIYGLVERIEEYNSDNPNRHISLRGYIVKDGDEIIENSKDNVMIISLSDCESIVMTHKKNLIPKEQ